MKTKQPKQYTPDLFRAELRKRMPGFKWTVHKGLNPQLYMRASGTISSGFNRCCTLNVYRRVNNGVITFSSQVSGYSKHARFTNEISGDTLAQSLRNLQCLCEVEASNWNALTDYLVEGRKALKETA